MFKKKKGFVLVETLIVTSVLVVALMIVYQNYNSTVSMEKTKFRYDDIADIYKTFYLKDYLEHATGTGKKYNTTGIPLNLYGLYYTTQAANKDDGDYVFANMQKPKVVNEITCKDDANLNNLCEKLGVEKIYVMRYCFIDEIKKVKMASAISDDLFNGDVDTATYVLKMGITNIKDYGASGKAKYQLIVKFSKKYNDGSFCSGDDCVKSFASININLADMYDWSVTGDQGGLYCK